MAAGILNIYIEAGATWTLDMVVKDGDGKPRDFTQAVGRCQIRVSACSSQVVAVPVVSFPADKPGAIHLELSAEDTRAIPAPGKCYSETSKYYWDLEVEIGGKVYRIVNGEAKVSPEVTK